MIVLPPIKNVFKLELDYQVTTVAGSTRMYFKYSGNPLTQTQCHDLCTAANTSWAAGLASMVSSTQKLYAVTVTDLDSPTANTAYIQGQVAGTRSGGELPINVAVNVAYQINRRYRGGHPRGYHLGGVDTDTTDGRHWIGAFITSFDTALSTFVSGMISNNGTVSVLNQVAVSYYSGHTWVQNAKNGNWEKVPTLRSAPLLDNVTVASAQTLIGTQRRRLRAEGP